MGQANGPAIHLFAKAPVAGRVKTRLEPMIGADACARLAAAMLRRTCATLSQHWPGPRVISAAPDISHPLLHELAREHGFTLAPQRGEDLGERMAHALEHGIAAHGAAAVIGADVPHAPPTVIESAWRILRSGGEVVGAAADGGFYLLGLASWRKALFRGIRWGGEEVFSSLLGNAASLGVSLQRLPELRDIDQPADLHWLAGHDVSFSEFLAPQTDGLPSAGGQGG